MVSYNKKELLVPILITKILKFKIKDLNIAIINIDAYYIAYCLKKTQIFTISMKNL